MTASKACDPATSEFDEALDVVEESGHADAKLN